MSSDELKTTESEIIARVEQLSGCPVVLLHDPGLKTLATVEAATRQHPAHIVRYRDDQASAAYQIAYECGFLLRLFALPPGEQVQLAGTAGSRETVTSEVIRLNPNLEPEQAKRLGDMLYDGLMLQLRSCGPGIKVDLWLFSEYPDLRGLQAASMEQQARENTGTLNPDLDRQFPPTVVRASRAMNSACALFTADLFHRAHLAVPYQAAGLERIARELLSVVADDADAPLSDRMIIDAWAQRLGISGWYEWVPSDSPSQESAT